MPSYIKRAHNDAAKRVNRVYYYLLAYADNLVLSAPSMRYILVILCVHNSLSVCLSVFTSFLCFIWTVFPKSIVRCCYIVFIFLRLFLRWATIAHNVPCRPVQLLNVNM